jgi:integrase
MPAGERLVTFESRPRHPVTGRRFRLRARTKRELEAYLHRLDDLRTQLKLEIKSPEEVDRELRHLRHGPVTLERAAVAYCERASLSPLTRTAVRTLLAGHMRKLARQPLAAIDGPAVAAWIAELEHVPLEPTTIGTAWRRLSAIAAHARERGWIGSSPWGSYRPKLRSSRRPPREAARTVQEFVRLLFAARDLDCTAWVDYKDAGDREAMMACAGLLGLRQGELGGLRWTDVDPGPPITVLVARQWNGKPLKRGCAPRRIETIPELGAILATYRSRLELVELFDPRGPVFPWREGSKRGRPVHYQRGEVLTRLNVRAAAARAGLPNVASWSAHSLRDTFVTLESAASGGDLVRVQTRSRHASLASLVRYLRALSRTHPASPSLRSLPGRV